MPSVLPLDRGRWMPPRLLGEIVWRSLGEKAVQGALPRAEVRRPTRQATFKRMKLTFSVDHEETCPTNRRPSSLPPTSFRSFYRLDKRPL